MRNLRLAANVGLVCAGTLGVTSVAFGLPWDIDMADSQAVKAYEEPMRPLPDGVVAQPMLYATEDGRTVDLTPKGFSPYDFDRMAPEAALAVNPVARDDASLETGSRMFQIYCTPCHGDGTTLGPVAAPGRFPGVVPLTTGSLKSKPDGYLFATVKRGGASMPYYGWAMTDTEIWSLVHHLRTLKNAAYEPPQPTAPAEEVVP